MWFAQAKVMVNFKFREHEEIIPRRNAAHYRERGKRLAVAVVLRPHGRKRPRSKPKPATLKDASLMRTLTYVGRL